jgi:hypothetical protein
MIAIGQWPQPCQPMNQSYAIRRAIRLVARPISTKLVPNRKPMTARRSLAESHRCTRALCEFSA